MIQHIKRLAHAGILLLLAASCTAPVDIETVDSPPVVSIYGCFTDELKPQWITVSLSSGYFDVRPNRALSGAVAEVSVSNGHTFTLAENPAHPGRYQTSVAMACTPGLAYRLTVKTDRNGLSETYTATAVMPAAATADSIRVKSETALGRQSYKLYLYAQDSPAEDYYLGVYEVNGTLFDKISQYGLSSDERFNGQYLNAWEFGRFEAAEDADADADAIRINPGDTVTLHFSRIEKGYYNFLHQCRNGMSGDSPFSGPAANITTNLSGGAVGYFAAYAPRLYQTRATVENQPLKTGKRASK
jgi:hypothetical protein